MSVAAGDRLGPYEITGKLGEGGMGEVWRATDTRLRREVAIKALPAAFTADRERLARFEREAQVLAQLHHSNVASIFGLEESDGSAGAKGARARVMELVEGDDLAAIVARGPLPLDEALAIARQIAEALEAAHEQGIVHRDLKPANIKVRSDGTVKVLDFGLAKAAADAGLSDAETMTISGTGVIVGTAAYMSPEQAQGADVNRQADIWAFGCVLYEMLVGRRVFEGTTATETLKKVLTSQPDFDALPADTPPSVRRLLRRCLEPALKRRLRDIGDAGIDLDDASADEAGRPAPGDWSRRQAILRLGSAAALGAAASAAGMWRFARSPNREPLRYFFTVPDGTRIALPPPYGAVVSAGVLSPDGSKVAFVAADPTKVFRLWVYERDSFE